MTHLGVLGSANLIDSWCDDRIDGGADWEREIEQAIDHARVAVLLVTAHFLTSRFILDKEIPPILQRRARAGLKVIPIIAKPCAWNNIDWLAKMNVRPKNASPVWRDRGRHADQELNRIINEIAASIKPG